MEAAGCGRVEEGVYTPRQGARSLLQTGSWRGWGTQRGRGSYRAANAAAAWALGRGGCQRRGAQPRTAPPEAAGNPPTCPSSAGIQKYTSWSCFWCHIWHLNLGFVHQQSTTREPHPWHCTVTWSIPHELTLHAPAVTLRYRHGLKWDWEAIIRLCSSHLLCVPKVSISLSISAYLNDWECGCRGFMHPFDKLKDMRAGFLFPLNLKFWIKTRIFLSDHKAFSI